MAGALEQEVADYYAACAGDYDARYGYDAAELTPSHAAIVDELRARFHDRDVLEVACGTGFWTAHVAATARSVLATDLGPRMLAAARARLANVPRARVELADAYRLDRIPTAFDGAFAVLWWCHVPRSRLRAFLRTLHTRLVPGSPVQFVCQLPDLEAAEHRTTADGDRIAMRVANGRRFAIIKNVPDEHDVQAALHDLASVVDYASYPALGLWRVAYVTR